MEHPSGAACAAVVRGLAPLTTRLRSGRSAVAARVPYLWTGARAPGERRYPATTDDRVVTADGGIEEVRRCGGRRASCTSISTPSSRPSSSATSRRCAAGRWSSAGSAAAAWWRRRRTRPAPTAPAPRCRPWRRAGGAHPSSWPCCVSCPRWSSRCRSTRPTWTSRPARGTTSPWTGSPRWAARSRSGSPRPPAGSPDRSASAARS